MGIVKFEDGQLVNPAYVIIDGVQHEITPAVYEGNTPLSSYNLNRMQEKILEDGIVVSPTEPTTNRRKVWMQKGKNLFNKNDYDLFKGYINGETKTIVANTNANSIYIKVKPNTTYTISRKVFNAGESFAVGTLKNRPSAGDIAIKYATYSSQSSATVTTGNDEKYLLIYLMWESNATVTLKEILDNIQIEQNSVATKYESYINPTIYVKNNNDIYEEFIKKEESEINIVTGQEVATNEYINGKQIFIKELETGNLGNANYTYIQTGLTNVNYIKCEGRVYNGSITFMLPHIGSSEQENIALFINGNIVNIKTETNRTTFSGKVRVYYTKN